jgi:hypothetical protein
VRTFAVVIVIGLLAVVPLACGDVLTSPDSGDAGAANDASGGETDAFAEADAPNGSGDAGAKTIACGSETCKLPGEVCCVFTGSGPRQQFCAPGACPASPPLVDAGEYDSRVVVGCDDPTDCDTPGNVCCAGTFDDKCSPAYLTLIECRAAGACPSCTADGGLGYQLCRAAVASDCPASTCSGTFASLSPEWEKYRFCK